MLTNSLRFQAENCRQSSFRIYTKLWLALDTHTDLNELTFTHTLTYTHALTHAPTYLHKHFKDVHTNTYLRTHISAAYTHLHTHLATYILRKDSIRRPSGPAAGKSFTSTVTSNPFWKIYYKLMLRNWAPSRGSRLCRPLIYSKASEMDLIFYKVNLWKKKDRIFFIKCLKHLNKQF